MVHLLLFLLDNALVISGRFVKVNPFAKRRYRKEGHFYLTTFSTHFYGKGSLR